MHIPARATSTAPRNTVCGGGGLRAGSSTIRDRDPVAVLVVRGLLRTNSPASFTVAPDVCTSPSICTRPMGRLLGSVGRAT